jgi:hypothetical protein
LRIVGFGAGSAASVVVTVDVEDDERAVIVLDPLEERADLVIETRVQLTRSLEDLLGEGSAPHIEAPAIVGLEADGLIARSIQIEFEARTTDDHTGRSDIGEHVGVGVLLAEAFEIRERDVRTDVVSQAVARVKSGRDDRAVASLDHPR